MEVATQSPKTTQAWRVKDIYKVVTDYIVNELEQGIIPWQKPVRAGDNGILEMPMNPVTNNYYQKINVILLWCSTNRNNYTSNEWAGLKQWNTIKQNVRRNEKGTLITYFDAMYKEVNGQLLKTPFLNYTYVFNRCQLASFDREAEPQVKLAPPLLERISKIDEFIANTGAIIQQHNGAAHYVATSDKILLPYTDVLTGIEVFNDQSSFYPMLLSKLIQWTGAKHRLNRFAGLTKGDHADVTEELVSEFGTNFLCSNFRITSFTESNDKIEKWINVLQDNKQCMFSAVNDALYAVNYLYDL